ncbi:MAG: glutamyl-tRNA amidotransferase [Rhodobacteraceae bacterium]|nr:glutamyl-tRNA amidotransferase [Paracoccaceae bacterium]
MLRSELNDALKSAMKTKDTCAVGTIRLILASVKDQDICARTDGDSDGISDDQVLALLNTMVKQRRESIRLYEQGGRLELAQREQAEIDVIRRFMPSQLEGESFQAAIQDAILEVEAKTIKDMGKTMALLKKKYPGQMDFSKASGVVREKLV